MSKANKDSKAGTTQPPRAAGTTAAAQPNTEQPSILLSYRRADSSAYALLLYDALTARFGASVFMDIDSLAPGVDFANTIHDTLESCDVVLVLIGPSWGSVTDTAGHQRLSDKEDLVRIEVETALSSKAVVVPVLVGGASMPTAEQLPKSLAPLLRRNAVEITDRRWRADVSSLMDYMASAEGFPNIEGTATASAPAAAPSGAKRRGVIVGAVVAAVLVAGGIAAVALSGSGPGAATRSTASVRTTIMAWPAGSAKAGQVDAFWQAAGSSNLRESQSGNLWGSPYNAKASNVASVPVVVLAGTRHEETIFYRGSDGDLWKIAWDPKTSVWVGPTHLTSVSVGKDLTVVVWPAGTPTAGQIDAFWKGSGSNQLWEASSSNDWSSAHAVGGATNVASAPTALIVGTHHTETVYYQGTQGTLQQVAYTTKWVGPTTLTTAAVGKDPSIVEWPAGTPTAGQVDAFWKESGTTQLWEANSGNGWRAYGIQGASNLLAPPTAVIAGKNKLESVFYQGTNTHLFQVAYDGKQWGSPVDLHQVTLG